MTVLGIFYNSIDDKIDEIYGYYNNEDWENYTIKVHALKSSARLVGAMKLSKEAEALEMAGKAGDISFIKSATIPMLDELVAYKGPLSEHFAKENQEAADTSGSADRDKSEALQEKAAAIASQDFSEVIIKSMYTALLEGAKQKNKEFLKKTFKEIDDYTFAEKHTQTIEELKKLFEASDYDGMIQVIEKME